MYEVTVEQRVKRNGYSSTEVIEGTVKDFDALEALVGVITTTFPDATITISPKADDENEDENKEEK